MSNCKWFRGTNSARKGQWGPKGKASWGGSGVLWVLKVAISSELASHAAPASNEMWNRSKRRSQKKKKENSELVSYFWQIFQRLGLRVDFGFLTLTPLPLPILIPILSSFLACLAIRLSLCACDRMAKSHRLWVFHYVLTLQRQVEVEESERKSPRRSRNRSTDRGHYVYVTFVEFLSDSDWQGIKS